MQLSASSAALDLALSQSPGPEAQSNGWGPFSRHRHSQQSLPQNVFDIPQDSQQSLDSPLSSSNLPHEKAGDSPTSVRQLNRRSMEATLASYAQKNVVAQTMTNGARMSRPSLANLQSSYSTNDIPTLKNINGISTSISPPKTSSQQQFHNHNASLGRIPAHAVNPRHSREISNGVTRREEQNTGVKLGQSELQASAAPFGPSISTTSPGEPVSASMPPPSLPQYATPAYYGGYGMQLMNMGMTPVQLGNQLSFNSQVPPYQSQTPFTQYPHYGQMTRVPDSQARVIQQRRIQNVEGI